MARSKKRQEGYFDITIEPLDPQYAPVLAQAIVDTVRDPLLVLNCHLSVTVASRSFFRNFAVAPEEVIGRSVYEILDGRFKIARLASLLDKILPEHAVAEDFEIDAEFPRIGQRVVIVNAREVFFTSSAHKAILLSFADVTHRRFIEKEGKSLFSMKPGSCFGRKKCCSWKCSIAFSIVCKSSRTSS